jgi:hypothetical protein
MINKNNSIIKQVPSRYNYKSLKVYLILTAFVASVLLFVSPDSYLHDLNSLYDSSCFFLCGKAWMNGLIPYVDFSDSKGPLLWLIYGLGYLIDNNTRTGVYWISCLFYSITLLYVFKMANIFLHDYRHSFIVAILSCLFYFNVFIHNEIRAEDFCQLFIIISLYYTCRILYMPHNKSMFSTSAFVFGVSLGATLLIKFNISVILIIFPIIIGFYAYKEKYNILKGVVWFFAGFSLMTVPFLLYFLFNNCLGAFFNEYFLRTFITASNYDNNTTVLSSIIQKLTQPNVFLFILIVFCCSLLPIKVFKEKRYIPLILFVWFFFISYQNSWNYYFNNLSVFGVFGLLSLMMIHQRSAERLRLKNMYIGILAITVFITITISDVAFVPTIRNSFFMFRNEDKMSFYAFEKQIAKETSPKILYWGTLCNGNGISANCLPACKYFAEQTGATKDMNDNQKIAVLNKQADFVILPAHQLDKGKLLDEIGYVKVADNQSGLVLYKCLNKGGL